ncbi:MAG TPA: START domain-containing protein [Agitococcus sp.]|nr:START domain-containing protein [Agitococcus sp.]
MCHEINGNNNQYHQHQTLFSKKLLSAVLFSTLANLSLVTSSAYALDNSAISAQAPAINRDGVKVWTYKEQGNPAVSYQASVTLNTSLNNTIALIINHKTAAEWAPYVGKIEVISPLNAEGVMIYRMELDLPFPMTDRDVVIKSQLRQRNTGEVWLENTAINDDRAPEREGLVRIKHYQGSWQLRPLKNNQLEVTTNGYADLGGAIPLSFSNLFVKQQPYQMLVNLRRYLQENPNKQLASN